MTRAKLLQEIDGAEFCDWMAFKKIEYEEIKRQNLNSKAQNESQKWGAKARRK